MESSKQKVKKDQLFDRFRNSWVAATPEEKVRQKLLSLMIEQLGYPKELLAVEKQLSEIPHLKSTMHLPKRRADILCFAKNIHPEHEIFPLLLIECKEGKSKEGAEPQVLGYNHFVQAPYVAVANEIGVNLIYPEFLSFLPTYKQLIDHICP